MEKLSIGTMIMDHTEDVLYPYIDFMASLGMTSCQICRVTDDLLNDRAASDRFINYLREKKIEPVSIFLHTRVRAGGNGLVSDAERPARFVSACRQMAWGARYGVKYISCHVGGFPEHGTADYDRWIADMQELIRFAADMGQDFLFETGPEPAEDLKQALEDLNEKNAGINFDPANLLWYDKTDPAEFAEMLFPYFRLIHCKDAVRPVPGGEWHGEETVLGEGGTNFFALLESLLKKGFRGPLIIEREIPFGEERCRDLTVASAKLAALRAKYL